MTIKVISVGQFDNRDEHSTWIQIDDDVTIDINPVELYQNMLENCSNKTRITTFDNFINVQIRISPALEDEVPKNLANRISDMLAAAFAELVDGGVIDIVTEES